MPQEIFFRKTLKRLKQGFPTWGTCTPRGKLTYLQG